MNRKSISMVIILLFLISNSMPFASSNQTSFNNIIYVDDDGGADYTRIQDAIDNASDGDTIYVYNGIYYENVIVDKTINLIGENINSTIIDGNNTDDVVYVTADYINISNFTVQNSGLDVGNMYHVDSGIAIFSNYCTIKNIAFKNNNGGIYLENSHDIKILENYFTYSYCYYPILFHKSDNNLISNNEFYDTNNGDLSSISLIDSDLNLISNNEINNCYVGLYIYSEYEQSDFNIIFNNNISNCEFGIYLEGCRYSNISENRYNENFISIYLDDCSDSIISNNIIDGTNIYNIPREGTNSNYNQFIISTRVSSRQNYGQIILNEGYSNNILNNSILNGNIGIDLYYSNTNSIINNTIVNNTHYGLYLTSNSDNNLIINNFIRTNSKGLVVDDNSNNNIIYRNIFINNTENANDNQNNIWDNGYPSGGNYWDDFDEPSEGAFDNNIDGIADSPYYISGGSNQDLYPLMNSITYPPVFIWVDDDFNNTTPGSNHTHFNYIQEGINAVAENGTVYVFNGTYYENLFVLDKTIDLIGEDRNNTIIDGGDGGINDVVYVDADGVIISGFTMRNSGYMTCGLFLCYSDNAHISKNIISNTWYGVYIGGSQNNTINGNYMSSNTVYGIVLEESNNNTISNNIGENNEYGIYIYNSNNNTISDNILANNSDGIFLKSSSYNKVSNCIMYNSTQTGIEIYSSQTSFNADSNQIWDCEVYNCNVGFQIKTEYLSYANANIIKNSKSHDNEIGISLLSSGGFTSSNQIYHNCVYDNLQNAYSNGGINLWDNGYPNGGNYWDDYSGLDNDFDGIGDTPYPISGGSNQDLYPLMFPYGTPFVYIHFKSGWNLITLPLTCDMTMASQLAENITGCITVNKWDALNQTYKPYIVGGPPDFDFPIYPGLGLFIEVSENSTLAITGLRPDPVSIDLKIPWNLIGWYGAEPTMASSLAENITGCLNVNMWDSINQTYKPYIVGGPPDFDFPVTAGMGLFVEVDTKSTWTGEG